MLQLLLLAALMLLPTMAGQAAATGQASQQAPEQTAPPATAPASVAEMAPLAEMSTVTEEALRSRLVGKQLFLRGGWLGESLSFNEHGNPTGHPEIGSYTLCAVQIDKVRLTKHRVELEGSRYALHFLGALPNEESANSVDRIRITPKKKALKITIDREIVLKQKKPSKAEKASKKKAAVAPAAGQAVASSESDAPASAPAPAAVPAGQQAAPAAAGETATEEEPEKPGEAPAADQASVTTTLSPAHAARVLSDALDKIFATGLDAGMRARMPEFWQLYYQAQAAGTDFHAQRPAAVDQHARLQAFAAPASNDYAQAAGIAGPALYRVVVGPDGVPQQIAVERPIGFGLDENAVAALRKATFQPATRGGQPVSEALDLTVLFRIYSQRTSQSSSAAAAADSSEQTGPAPAVKPALPGPYSAKPMPAQPQPAEAQPDTKLDQPPPDQPAPTPPASAPPAPGPSL